VPAEASRLRRRPGERDLRFFVAIGCVGATAALAAVLFSAGGDSSAQATTRCVSMAAAGVMGGGAWHFCGQDADAFCRVNAPKDDGLAAQCKRLALGTRYGTGPGQTRDR
jgi:hypothetical protein